MKYFRTGELIKAGDTIGKVGYCYKKIDSPSICISRSIDGKSADPMSIFGLVTTFIPPSISKPDYLKYKHSKESLLEAFKIFKSSLEEGHPGLYDYTSKEKLDSIFEHIQCQILKPMTSEEFRYLINPLIMAIRDSHTALFPLLYKVNDESAAPIMLGVIDGKLKIVSCINKYKTYLDSVVIKVNGEDAHAVIEKVRNTLTGADGFIETKNDRALMNGFMKYYRLIYQANEGFTFDITLSSGEHLIDKFSKTNKPEPNIRYFPSKQNPFTIRGISDKIAYLDLSTFELQQKDVEEIQKFIKNIAVQNLQNLIIDLRFNPGGSVDVTNNLFALFANSPFQSDLFSIVNKTNTYDFFKYTLNYSNVNGLFLDFKQINGKKGYYLNASDSFIKPNDSAHYNGKVYILTNEYSFSAAAYFAGLMVKYNRGTIVGRETGSTYYQLNAEKFAQVRLGETGLELYMPLIKFISSNKLIPRIPWGRGVIPDYTIKPSIDEAYQKEDKILDFTLNLINGTQ